VINKEEIAMLEEKIETVSGFLKVIAYPLRLKIYANFWMEKKQ